MSGDAPSPTDGVAAADDDDDGGGAAAADDDDEEVEPEGDGDAPPASKTYGDYFDASDEDDDDASDDDDSSSDDESADGASALPKKKKKKKRGDGSAAPAAKAAAAKGFMFSPAAVAAAAVVEAGASPASGSPATDGTKPPASATTDAPATVAEPSDGGDEGQRDDEPLPSVSSSAPTIGVVTEAPPSTHGVVYNVENARTFSWASNKLNGNDACEHYPRVEKAKGALRAGLPAVHKDLNTIQLNTKYRALPEALLGNVRCLGTLRLAKGTTRHWVAVQALSDPLRSSSDPLAAVVGKVRKRCCNIAPSALSRNKSLTRSCPCCLVGVPHPVERDRPVRRTSLFWLRR